MPILKSVTPHGYAVINPPAEIHHPKIPTYLPFDQAAQKLGLSEKVLTQQIQAGKIGAVQLPSGEVLVAADNNNGQYKTKAEIIAHNFAHLRGQTINAYQAQEKYGIHSSTFSRWARAGYIQFRKDQEGPRPQILMDEADVAYCAYVYRQKEAEYGNAAKVRLFDEKGNPYQLRYPDLAAHRRNK